MREPNDHGLRLADVPTPDADYADILRFAHTYDGYAEAGGFDAAGEIANARRHDSLDDLRTCLFFEARRYRHFGYDPEGEALEYIRDLVREIRARVR